MDDVEEALNLAAAVQTTMLRQASELAGIKVQLDVNIGSLYEVFRYFESLSMLLITNKLSASKEQKAAREALNTAVQLADEAVAIQETMQRYFGITASCDELVKLIENLSREQ